jgi:hypothetical protein
VPKYSEILSVFFPVFFFFFKNVWMQNIIQYKRYIFLPVIESTCDHFYCTPHDGEKEEQFAEHTE